MKKRNQSVQLNIIFFVSWQCLAQIIEAEKQIILSVSELCGVQKLLDLNDLVSFPESGLQRWRETKWMSARERLILASEKEVLVQSGSRLSRLHHHMKHSPPN